jgi:ferredoxin-NADP reductase
MDDGIIFYIKAMPKNPALARVPWTQRLADLVQTAAALPMLRLSGPFGHTDFEGYESLVMFAGGIGITPMIAIFTDLMHRAKAGRHIGRLQSVALVWMSRSIAEFRVFEEIFAMVHSASVLADEHARVDTKACNFHVRLHCTRRESWVSMNMPSSLDHVKMFVAQGRCDVAGRIEEFVSADPRQTMVAVCGPHNLTHTASRAAWTRRTDFHAEQFSF